MEICLCKVRQLWYEISARNTLLQNKCIQSLQTLQGCVFFILQLYTQNNSEILLNFKRCHNIGILCEQNFNQATQWSFTKLYSKILNYYQVHILISWVKFRCIKHFKQSKSLKTFTTAVFHFKCYLRLVLYCLIVIFCWVKWSCFLFV